MEKGRGKGTDTLQTNNVFTRKEYIEREAAIAVIHKWLSDIFGIDEVECTVLNKRLNAIPAADVVPVVRCKDCEYWDATQEAPLSEGCFLCTLEGGYPKGDFYCALGERRMDGDGE